MKLAQRGLLTAAIISLFAVSLRARADGPAPAPAAQLFDVKEGQLSYKLVHKLHEVTGVSHSLEGKVRVPPDGAAQVQVRAKVASFDSGNSNRDEHMREVTREAAHPYVSVRGTAAGLKLPMAAQTATLHATVELNGEKQALDIPIEVRPEGTGFRAKFSFPISLDGFKVDRPELLFVKVDDAVIIEGDLLLVPSP